MHTSLRVALLAATFAFIFGCGVEPVEQEGADATATSQDPLIFDCSSATTNSFTRSSGFFSSVSHVDLAGMSDNQAWAEGTFFPRAGTTRSTVRVSPRFEAGLYINMLPGIGSYGEATVYTMLSVTDASGRLLCSRTVDVLRRSTPLGYITDSRPQTNYDMSCDIDHDATGSAITVRVTLRTQARVVAAPPLSGPGGQAEARAFGSAGSFTVSQCETQLGWCTHAGAQLLALDSNGDSRTDHICVTSPSGFVHVNTTPSTGVPDEVIDQDVPDFCPSPRRLLTGDVNGDGRDDLVCVNTSNRSLRIRLANTSGLFPNVEIISNSIVAVACPNPVLADFNGDGADDLQCDTVGARQAIDLSDLSGQFPGADFETPTFCGGASLKIADLNADGRADQLCHSPITGTVLARFANTLGQFSSTLNFNSGTRGWCIHAGGRVLLADANGDRRSDLVCVTSGSGWVHVDYANPSGPLFDGLNERDADKDFCPETSGMMFPVDYSGLGREGLVCQVPAAPPTLPFGSNTLQPRL